MLPGACIGDVSPTCGVCIVCVARMEIGAIPTIHFARRRDIGAIRVILKRELIKGRRIKGVWWTRQCRPARLSQWNGRNSDAQDLSICRRHRINLGRRRKMAGLSHLRACPRSRGSNGRSVAAHIVLGIALFVIALLFISPTTSKADTLNCAQISDLSAARLRWAAARQSRVDAAEVEEKCRAYRIHFYDVVTARHAASICEDGIHRQRDLWLQIHATVRITDRHGRAFKAGR